MTKVVLFAPNQAIADIFAECAPEGLTAEWRNSSLSGDEKKLALSDAEVVVLHPAQLPIPVIRAAPKLRLIQLLTAGYDQIDIVNVPAQVSVATNGGANAWAVAEHTVALLLALYKRIVICDRTVREGGWRKNTDGFNTYEVVQKTVGIIGAGKIGRKVAQRLHAFETNILYFDPVPSPEMEATLGAKRCSLEDILTQADIISLHLPLTPESHHLIGAPQFAMMKPNAVVLNPSRGEIIDEKAMIEALKTGRILGAGLDVYHEEPVAPNNELLRLPNVVLTAHTAGHAYEGWYRRSRFAWENIVRLEADEPLLSTVEARRGL